MKTNGWTTEPDSFKRPRFLLSDQQVCVEPRAHLHGALKRRASIADSSSSHAAMKASILAVAGPAPEAAIQADSLRQGWEAAAEAQTEARLGR